VGDRNVKTMKIALQFSGAQEHALYFSAAVLDKSGGVKMKKLVLLKWSIIAGVLLGIGIKVNDFLLRGNFRCGIQEAKVCNWSAFITDTLMWAVITTVLVMVIVFGINYLFSYTVKVIKEKKPKSESKSEKKKKKEEKTKIEDEEIIKI